jgi:hypothetical protein
MSKAISEFKVLCYTSQLKQTSCHAAAKIVRRSGSSSTDFVTPEGTRHCNESRQGTGMIDKEKPRRRLFPLTSNVNKVEKKLPVSYIYVDVLRT